MGNGLDTLAYSPSDLDKQIENMDDNIEWLSYSEFKETRKILNILKNMTIDTKIIDYQLKNIKNGLIIYLLH